MICRKVELSEIEKVCKIYCLEEKIDITKEYIKKCKEIYKLMLQQGSYTMGCFEEDKLIGVINVNKILDYYPGYTNLPYIHLETFIVHKEYQNMGIGTKLINKVISEELKQSTYMIIQSNNAAVKHICEKCGMTKSLYAMKVENKKNV